MLTNKQKVIYEGVVKSVDKELKKRYNTKLRLEVGFLNGKYPNGMPVASVAYKNEYGTYKIPPRPFFRNAINDNSTKWVNFLKSNLTNDKGINDSFSLTGEMIRSDIVKSINKTTTPPNTNLTIYKKGSSHPLIDTGFMRASVTFEIKG